MKKRDRKILQERKEKLAKRLDRHHEEYGDEPVMRGEKISYEMSGRMNATPHGGIGAIHTMLRNLGLPDRLNEGLSLLKIHRPYFESDHILNLAYNVLCNGRRIADLEVLRNDTAYMDALGASRIPDPTTAGDFLRRFDSSSIEQLMEIVNERRLAVWDQCARRDKHFYDKAIVEIDGTIVGTQGECKEGMDCSYKGIWGYAPLIVTLANTGEVLYIENRSGNTRSCTNSSKWIDRAIELVRGRFKRVEVRGDTDFSSTEHLDRWSEKVEFVLGYPSCASLVKQAESLPEAAWTALERPPKYKVATKKRTRPENVKERIVREREYRNLRLLSEDVAEFDYKPIACEQSYRMVVLRKNLSVERGERTFLPEIRHFFYITNKTQVANADIVFSANQRCDQENIIAQLKSGINALRMPVDNLTSNWAYMTIASLAWTFKAWFGLMIADEKVRRTVVRMEFRKFWQNFIEIPCQIVHRARGLVYRVLAYNPYLTIFFETFAALRSLRFT